MAINIEAMRAKLEQSKNGKKASGKNSTMWKPQAGAQHIRILPTADGDPFREFHFHYNVGKNPGIYCSKRNDNGECPICDFASKLWREGTETDDQNLKNEAKKLFARKRYYSPVLVRGSESEGVKIWAYGKTAYETLLGYVLDPDYGDITDPQTGTDIKLTYTLASGPGAFPKTALQPRRRPSILCDDSVGNCEELLDSVPVIDNLFDIKTVDEVRALLDGYLSSDSSAEASSSETRRGKQQTGQDVDKAFAAFMNDE
tara:strand:- start:64 stop:837 length:774 start_codon:yes stop_codon:yes gene_type:complete